MTLPELAQQLARIEEEIVASRAKWQSKTKPFIFTHLKYVKDFTGLDVDVSVDRSIINLECVQFAFKDTLSGLAYNPADIQNQQDSFSGPIKKIGGILNFSQRYNGQVMVWQDYPYLDFQDRPLNKKQEIITTILQDKIDEEFINKMVQEFLSKVNTWHRREYKPSLRFLQVASENGNGHSTQTSQQLASNLEDRILG